MNAMNVFEMKVKTVAKRKARASTMYQEAEKTDRRPNAKTTREERHARQKESLAYIPIFAASFTTEHRAILA